LTPGSQTCGEVQKMPNHDPLCQATVFKVFSINGGPLQLDCPDCVIIARVREDERGRVREECCPACGYGVGEAALSAIDSLPETTTS
jgi:hypothetical protein